MRALVALLVAATLALGAPAATHASGVRFSVTTWSSGPSSWTHPHGVGHDHAAKVIVVPTRVFVAPSPCWAQGYWNYAWVPQISSYNLWVPAAWSPDGYWIEGHYEQRLSSSGYWQPYWVEGRWGAC